jgi:methyl-accepting chemotaxis protein
MGLLFYDDEEGFHMTRSWTFGRKLGLGFAVVVGIGALLAGVALYALRGVVESKDRVITEYGDTAIQVWKMTAATEAKIVGIRGYLLTRDPAELEAVKTARQSFADAVEQVRRRATDPEIAALLGPIVAAENVHQESAQRVIDLRNTDAAPDAVAAAFNTGVRGPRRDLERAVDALGALVDRKRDGAKEDSSAAAAAAGTLVGILTGVSILLAIAIAYGLTTALTRQIGSAVQHVQSSSSELQVASNQQAAGAKEHASAMNEITTTINELLATSRQIAESAQRVAHIARETAGAAKTGDQTVQKVQDSIAAIKRQMDVIVNHMLDLGRKSQQIGGVVELITELADQTNILSINASIEATGAGEAGRRFAVVAEEIRKLADRVAGSTKEIRSLVEEVRAAVNSTVMATEVGAKAVEAGARQYGDVTAAFGQIGSLVGTTGEAAREIELSTKQQATAVEQVNTAVSSVAQATKESEVSTAQTLQTATQLASLSADLSRLIHPAAG